MSVDLTNWHGQHKCINSDDLSESRDNNQLLIISPPMTRILIVPKHDANGEIEKNTME